MSGGFPGDVRYAVKVRVRGQNTALHDSLRQHIPEHLKTSRVLAVRSGAERVVVCRGEGRE